MEIVLFGFGGQEGGFGVDCYAKLCKKYLIKGGDKE